jgi:hypothetical protein
VTWDIDVTTRFRADVVGLDAEADAVIMGVLLRWMDSGPPRENARTMLGIEFYEAPVADRYLVAYSIDDVRQRFVVLWLREQPRPGTHG